MTQELQQLQPSKLGRWAAFQEFLKGHQVIHYVGLNNLTQGDGGMDVLEVSKSGKTVKLLGVPRTDRRATIEELRQFLG